MKDCVFCKIVSGEIPSKRLENTVPWTPSMTHPPVIVEDRQPQAAAHLLVISGVHVSSLSEAVTKEPGELALCMAMAVAYGDKHLPGGYRVVTNVGEDAGQVVKHLHLHILGGEKLRGI